MDEGKGRDVTKAVMGLVLIFAGTFLLILGVPKIPSELPTAAHAVSGAMPGAGSAYLATYVADVGGSIASYHKIMLASLFSILMGALLLYMSGESKKPE